MLVPVYAYNIFTLKEPGSVAASGVRELRDGVRERCFTANTLLYLLNFKPSIDLFEEKFKNSKQTMCRKVIKKKSSFRKWKRNQHLKMVQGKLVESSVNSEGDKNQAGTLRGRKGSATTCPGTSGSGEASPTLGVLLSVWIR